MIPLENTRRWPRLVSQRGRNEASATKLARNGNPLKLVLPPVKRLAAVPECPQQHVDSAESEQPGARMPMAPVAVCPGCDVRLGQVAEHLADQPGDDHEDDRPGEQVGRHREYPAGLPDPAKVPIAHDQDPDHREDQQAVTPAEPRESRYYTRAATAR